MDINFDLTIYLKMCVSSRLAMNTLNSVSRRFDTAKLISWRVVVAVTTYY